MKGKGLILSYAQAGHKCVFMELFFSFEIGFL